MKTKVKNAPVIGFLTPKIASPYISSVLDAFENRSYTYGKHNCSIRIYSTRGEQSIKKEVVASIASGREVDALAVLFLKPDPSTVALFRKHNIPLILIENDVKGAHSINVNNVKGAFKAVDYLAKNSRKHIGFVRGQTAGEEVGPVPLQREQGYRDALKKNKLKFRPELVTYVKHHTHSEGIDALDYLLAKEPKLDAVFCAAGDLTATGIIKQAKRYGYKIPSGLAVVGYDNAVIAPLVEPPLTTVMQPVAQMGGAAFDMCIDALDGMLKKEKKTVFEPELIIRESA
jgi:DNA-binding LacI/PurR family transcriptional regulator